jgi:hypothetical protein
MLQTKDSSDFGGWDQDLQPNATYRTVPCHKFEIAAQHNLVVTGFKVLNYICRVLSRSWNKVFLCGAAEDS